MAEEKEENPKPMNEFLYTWRIENVNLWWQKTGEKLKSPTFKVHWLPKFSFSLCLYPKGTEGNEDYISYFLAQEDQVSTANKGFKTDLYLLAVDGSKVKPESYEGFLSMRKYGMFGCPRFMSWDTLYEKSDYLPDDILTVCCRIWSEVKPDMKENKPTEVKACSDQSFARTLIKKEVIAKQMVIDNIALKGQKIGEIKSILQDYPIATFSASFGKISDHGILTIDIDVKKDDKIKMGIFKLMLIDEKRKKTFWMNTYSWNDVTEFENIVLSSHSPQSSEHYAPHEMFVEKFLFLACQFTFTTGFVVQKREKDDYGTNLNHLLPLYFPPSDVQTVQCPTLADALTDMHEDELFYDVKIENGTSYITAHKIVLCSRSTKFEALVKSQDKITSPQVIQVEDDIETLIRMVYFLYTDDISDINWQIATTLYSAAIKYEIGLLKHKCCNFINDNLDKSNVVEILLLAKKYNDIELIASARNFIMENRTAVYTSDEWDNFRKSHSDFAVEIMLPKFQSN
ncbi:hypothetical protein AVEN_66604-1 [Araneus ventricosus]|uniref:Uncharacterized protein n=1 Tax=Araneus ventricosus TaxID=182803 RepID=A0A4Y2M0K0_ARAVE|nr:hypothetical protein AVEN_66604-1 [Araneus ventricosus]